MFSPYFFYFPMWAVCSVIKLFALRPQIVATLVSDVSANVYFSFKNCWKLINSRLLVLELCETEKWILRKINTNHFLRFSYFHFIRHENYNNRLRHLSFAFQHVHFGLLLLCSALLLFVNWQGTLGERNLQNKTDAYYYEN